MKTNFDFLFESSIGRYQQGGYLIGDRIRFRKDCMELDFFKNKARSFQEMVQSCMDPNFDLNLRISAIKSTRPTTTQNYQGGSTDSPDDLYCDVIIEYAPGLYRNPMTVPIGAIELMDDGINRGPVPNSLKYPKTTQIKPTKVDADSSAKFDINLTNKNVKLPNGNNWDDSKPGAGNLPKK
jgi:hypothetical protein